MTAPRPVPAPGEDARLAVRGNVGQLVTRLAVDGYGAMRHEDPIEGYRLLTHTRLDPAVDGLRAAVHVRDVAAGLVYEHAMKARADGHSWAQIGHALGFEGKEWEGHDAGEIAFRLLVWHEPAPDVSPSWTRREGDAWWECRSCGERVRDRGPWEANPANTEEGHADSCERHHSDCLAYHEEWDDE